MKRRGILFCFVGPAGSGKTTFAARLLRADPDRLKLSVSVTSRTPRAGEQDGVHYHFVTREDFRSKVERGEFFEWEETHGNYYGTLSSTVRDAMASGIDLLLDVDIRGALNFKKSFPDNTVIAFVIPPSTEELKNRIKMRSSVSENELSTRLATARSEYARLIELAEKDAARVDYIVLNDELEQAYSRIVSILEAERARCKRLELEELRRLCTIGE